MDIYAIIPYPLILLTTWSAISRSHAASCNGGLAQDEQVRRGFVIKSFDFRGSASFLIVERNLRSGTSIDK